MILALFHSVRRFRDREEAGRGLAAELREYAGEDPIVLALPRGGVPVGYEIARELSAPLDICVVRKIGAPWQPELGLGAVAEGGRVYLSRAILAQIGISDEALADAIESKRREVEERVQKFRGDYPRPALQGRTAIIVDDGIATGGTVRAAIRAVRDQDPRQIVLAVPVAAPETVSDLAEDVERVVCLLAPPNLYAIGLWYEDFHQISDEEVADLLERVRRDRSGTGHAVA